jgi:alpha-L-arabinofuranosidase
MKSRRQAARLLNPGAVGNILAVLVLLCVVSLSSISQTRQGAAQITIDASKTEGAISPLLYGQFMEFMFGGIKGGLDAEQLRDRSFEDAPNAIGLPRYWERYPDDRNDDYGLSFLWDQTNAYSSAVKESNDPPEHSLLIEAGNGVITRHGFYQSGIPVRKGIEYRGYLWIKTNDYQGAVAVALEADVSGGEKYAESEIKTIAGDWKKYEFTLRPNASDPLARFAVLFNGQGKLWLDQISLIPGDAVGGVRADVFQRVKDLRPAFIRWPGGNVAQDYHWLWGVGPRDRRRTWVNLSWKNEPEPSDFGTDEFVEFSRRVGAEPSITVNVEGRGATVEEAAAWVEYCNAPATSKYGAMRALNGHPEPFAVKYWEVGNEIWGDWVRGHSDAETYARNFNRYAEAMRKVDPAIKLIAVGDNDMRWNRIVLERAGKGIDYLAIHHYYGQREMKNDALNLMARPLLYERFYKQVAALLHEAAPAREIRLAINEWGLDLPVARQYSIESALYAARLLNVFERSNGLVGMSAVSDLVNGWPGGVIQAGRQGVFVTPTYLANMLYSNHRGSVRLDAKVESPTFDSTLEGRNVPYLDAAASRSTDGKHLYVKAVNTDQQRPLLTKISMVGLKRVAPEAEVETLTADSLAAANNFSTPDAVRIKSWKVKAGNNFTIELPKHSVSVITLSIN